MANLSTELKEIERLRKILIELTDKLQTGSYDSLENLRPPMYKGDEDRYDEVIKALEDAGGINDFNNKGHRTDCYYYIGESNMIRFASCKATVWLLHQIFELKELPPKKIELVEGEFYKCKGTPNDTCIFIYKKVNEYDTSYLCGITICENFSSSPNGCFGAIENITPATQEQKEILLKRIDDEGYIYNKGSITLVKKKEKVKFTLSDSNYDRMLVRDANNEKWRIKLFKKTYYPDYVIDSSSTPWKFALPFTEETKKLINTTDMPDKEYILIP